MKASTKATLAAKRKTNAPAAHGVGRRKSAVARAWLRHGKGENIIMVNGKESAQYFDTEVARLSARKPFVVYTQAAAYDVDVNVCGGGLEAQADAVGLAIARALCVADEAARTVLKEQGLLTVDSRVKERKKYGQKAARRRFQFVKR
ncbi:MAG: 30S ribosomal protein S9 [candidate division TM6 bacterium GW2011_GWE2_41_16]|nr:MAG: 30S ribosomal protein S9 [candidate division TM6 bacterium GW2011_GWE2_41_16]